MSKMSATTEVGFPAFAMPVQKFETLALTPAKTRQQAYAAKMSDHKIALVANASPLMKWVSYPLVQLDNMWEVGVRTVSRHFAAIARTASLVSQAAQKMLGSLSSRSRSVPKPQAKIENVVRLELARMRATLRPPIVEEAVKPKVHAKPAVMVQEAPAVRVADVSVAESPVVAALSTESAPPVKHEPKPDPMCKSPSAPPIPIRAIDLTVSGDISSLQLRVSF